MGKDLDRIKGSGESIHCLWQCLAVTAKGMEMEGSRKLRNDSCLCPPRGNKTWQIHESEIQAFDGPVR